MLMTRIIKEREPNLQIKELDSPFQCTPIYRFNCQQQEDAYRTMKIYYSVPKRVKDKRKHLLITSSINQKAQLIFKKNERKRGATQLNYYFPNFSYSGR